MCVSLLGRVGLSIILVHLWGTTSPPAWRAGRLACWLAGCLAAWLLGLAGWLAGWVPQDLKVGKHTRPSRVQMVCFPLSGWLAGRLAGWLAGWLDAWLAQFAVRFDAQGGLILGVCVSLLAG